MSVACGGRHTIALALPDNARHEREEEEEEDRGGGGGGGGRKEEDEEEGGRRRRQGKFEVIAIKAGL